MKVIDAIAEILKREVEFLIGYPVATCSRRPPPPISAPSSYGRSAPGCTWRTR